EDERDNQESPPRAARAQGGYCDGDSRRTHQDQNTGRISATLRFNVGLEYDCDRKCDCHINENERARSPSPIGSHAVAWQVTRDYIQQASHRRSACEPENQDSAQVVNTAEQFAQKCVREVSQSAPARFPSLLKLFGSNER